MSTIKVNAIKNTSTDDGGIAIDNSGHVQVDGVQLPTAGAFSGRNLIINGAQEVDQRGSGSSAIGTLTNGKYITDRWNVRGEGNTTGQCSQSANVPDGFVNSLLIEVGATAVARSANTNRFIRHNMEGYSMRSLRWGTSAAKAATISFWIKSSLTGTYSFAFFSGSLDQHYATNYTIDTADTWEFKTISVPGPTSGTFRTDNGLALYIQWDLGTGSNYQTSTLNQWASGDKRCSNNAVDFFNTANATLRITGIQFEMGEKVTSFEYRSYGDELARCQRYFCKSYNDGVNPGTNTSIGIKSIRNYSSDARSDHSTTCQFPVTMRAAPTVVFYAKGGTQDRFSTGNSTYGVFSGTNTISSASNHGMTGLGGVSLGTSVSANSFTYFHFTAAAEL